MKGLQRVFEEKWEKSTVVIIERGKQVVHNVESRRK